MRTSRWRSWLSPSHILAFLSQEPRFPVRRCQHRLSSPPIKMRPTAARPGGHMKSYLAAIVVAAVCAGPAFAQSFKPDPIDEAAAKREGKVTWYTSTPVAAGQF